MLSKAGLLKSTFANQIVFTKNLATMVKSTRYIITKKFEGMPKESDFNVVTEDLPAINNGEFVTEAVFLSVDPYMRAYVNSKPGLVGNTMIGSQVGKVIESKNPKFPIGTHVVTQSGWCTHAISDGKDVFPLPKLEGKPLSLFLGILGMPGNTAYFGFTDICKPKAGETVIVNAAAGAVGHHVGMIAKIKGCKVIGLAGSDDKCEWIKSLGFDHAINYKTTENLRKKLIEVAPQGIDCFFDNVGGEMSSTIISHMNQFGRISVCGSISSYNDISLPKVTILQPSIVFKSLKMEGFIVTTKYGDRWMEGIQQNMLWLKENKLSTQETVVDGFENMVKGLNMLLTGDNTGKAIVKV